MLHHSSITGTQELPLPRKCLGWGATPSQPHLPSLGIKHRGACRCWASCHPQDPLLPHSHSPVSSSLQPLCGTKQPSYTELVNGCEAAPPVFPQLIPHSTFPPKPTAIHPHASLLDSCRGQSKAHSGVMLKLLLFCKGQEHLKANTHRKMEWGVPQASIKADTPSPTFQDASQVLHLPTSSPAPLLKPTAPHLLSLICKTDMTGILPSTVLTPP